MKDKSSGNADSPSGLPDAIPGAQPAAGTSPTIRLLQIDSDTEPGATTVKKTPAKVPGKANPVGPGVASQFAELDWLDTIIDEVLTGNASKREVALTRPQPQASQRPAERSEFADLGVSRAASDVLARVLLGYSPIIEQSRGVIGTRLTVVPIHASRALDACALLEAIAEVWPEKSDIVCLNLASESLVKDLLRGQPASNVMLEIPAHIAEDPSHTDALVRLAGAGTRLLLKGRPTDQLPRRVLPCFTWAIIDLSEERRRTAAAPPLGVTRTIPHIQAGVRTMAELRRSFALGAAAVIGWPLHEPLSDALSASPDMRVVLDMIQRMDRGDSTEAVDHVLMRDPVLAFELLNHLNGAADVHVEAGSMSHAISMMGRDKLRRWLAGLLTRSADDIHLRPANFAALRRGLLMRMLAHGIGQPEARGELFMCGVFSLLDRIYARPVGELVRKLALPDRVHAALVDSSGPYFPLLELARAVEAEDPHHIRSAAEAVFMQPSEINRALMRSLLVASQLERQPFATASVPI